VQYLVQNEALGPVIAATSKLTPYLIVGAVFTFLYMYMPNTDVKLKSALVGGLAGGFLWATVGMIFTAFVVNSTRNDAIYASFAIGIVTLIWLYLNWLVLLIGSQLAFYHQNPAYLRIGRREPRLSNAMRERLALNIMFLVGKSFRDPDTQLRMGDLSTSLKIPSITLAPITTGLEQSGLLSLTENEVLQPGREMSRILLNDILDVVRVEGETGSHRDPKWSAEIESVGAKLDDALAKTVGGKSLSDLLDDA
jgi:membrane protein